MANEVTKLIDRSITEVNLDSDVTVIGIYAFAKCYSLTSVTIPSSVTDIQDRAFNSCTSLASVTINATTPPQLRNNSYAFANTNDCPIYVPASSVDTYKAASGWSDYASRIQAIPS